MPHDGAHGGGGEVVVQGEDDSARGVAGVSDAEEEVIVVEATPSEEASPDSHRQQAGGSGDEAEDAVSLEDEASEEDQVGSDHPSDSDFVPEQPVTDDAGDRRDTGGSSGSSHNSDDSDLSEDSVWQPTRRRRRTKLAATPAGCTSPSPSHRQSPSSRAATNTTTTTIPTTPAAADATAAGGMTGLSPQEPPPTRHSARRAQAQARATLAAEVRTLTAPPADPQAVKLWFPYAIRCRAKACRRFHTLSVGTDVRALPAVFHCRDHPAPSEVNDLEACPHTDGDPDNDDTDADGETGWLKKHQQETPGKFRMAGKASRDRARADSRENSLGSNRKRGPFKLRRHSLALDGAGGSGASGHKRQRQDDSNDKSNNSDASLASQPTSSDDESAGSEFEFDLDTVDLAQLFPGASVMVSSEKASWPGQVVKLSESKRRCLVRFNGSASRDEWWPSNTVTNLDTISTSRRTPRATIN
eukprot:m.103261 g.103261  ORF g.103261 m.103261 type:complete len:471 (+) comp15565_c0_seq1:69-1481(+)